jgi:hypothetical protein
MNLALPLQCRLMKAYCHWCSFKMMAINGNNFRSCSVSSMMEQLPSSLCLTSQMPTTKPTAPQELSTGRQQYS